MTLPVGPCVINPAGDDPGRVFGHLTVRAPDGTLKYDGPFSARIEPGALNLDKEPAAHGDDTLDPRP